MNQATLRSLKRRLRRAWNPFFGQFGGLLPSQLAAIPEVLSGRNVFLSAATASGKTEALLAPIAELAASGEPGGLAVVYVVPTRALVNDIEKRCRGPLEDMGLSCRVRTGDRPEFNEHSPERFVITTPESLDSLVTRKPDLFHSLQAIVLDELHLLDKTYRGDQVRLLLRRLQSSQEIQVCAASATLDSPEEMAQRYAVDPLVLEVAGGRGISYRDVESIPTAANLLRAEGAATKKVLAFANSRRECEQQAKLLRDHLQNWPVYVHHGSLHRHEREETETALRETPRWLCVATTTLEIGIDVGDVDAVLLLEPPLSVASLLQRIGRANRRSSVVNVLALSQDEEDKRLYEEQFRRARLGMLDHRPYHPDLSVVVQQMFAMTAGAPGGLDDGYVRSIFDGFCEETQLTKILVHLEETGFLSHRLGRWYASPDVMDLARTGKIYSNVPNSFNRSVVDATTGREVGSVSDVVDTVFSLAGRTWRVVHSTGAAITVQPSSGATGVAVFQTHPSRGAFTRYLPKELR